VTSTDVNAQAVAERLTDRYNAALASLEAAAVIAPALPRELFETCEHLTPIAEDCLACEPPLDPFFDEEAPTFEDDRGVPPSY
jgi:hypothetical protein